MKCAPPSGAQLRCCGNEATTHLNFGCDEAGGSWYLCDACCVLIVFWLEDEYRDHNPVFEREPIKLENVNLWTTQQRLRPT